jgi:aminoglycoside phosphotransferase (APT) family kinase protein
VRRSAANRDAWCDWADATLADLHPTVLVHADLHGDNQVWKHDRLRLVVDFETASVAERSTTCARFPEPVQPWSY